MELIVTLHGQHAASLDAGDDQWLHARTTSMGAMSARISATWTEKPATRQLNCWLNGCLPENGLLARYRARAQSMLQAAGVAYEKPKVAEILWANADAEFAGAVRFDTDRSPSAAHVSGYERLTESEIGNRLGEADRIARGLARGPAAPARGPCGHHHAFARQMFGKGLSCTCSASVFIPRRMSVTPPWPATPEHRWALESSPCHHRKHQRGRGHRGVDHHPHAVAQNDLHASGRRLARRLRRLDDHRDKPGVAVRQRAIPTTPPEQHAGVNTVATRHRRGRLPAAVALRGDAPSLRIAPLPPGRLRIARPRLLLRLRHLRPLEPQEPS